MKMILIEFNELSPSLIEGYMAAGALPNFKAFKRASQAFVTDAGEDGHNLEPWIQWVTLHTGLSYAEHGVFHLGEAGLCEAPRLWNIATEDGGNAWVCGSMDDRPGGIRAHLPDFWSKQAAVPASLAPFQNLVRAFVREGKGDGAFGARGALDFARFMLGHGLSLGTVVALVRQAFSEARGRGRWRRTDILDRLQFDLFRHVYKKTNPSFATFFSNSTAHLQHHGWSEVEQRVFLDSSVEGAPGWDRSPVFRSYRNMDRLLGEFMKLAAPDTALVLCTALSQQGNPGVNKNSALFRPRDPAAFLRFAGVEDAYEIETAMAGLFGFRFASEEQARRAADKLSGVTLHGAPLGIVEREGSKVIYNHARPSLPPGDAVIEAEGGARLTFGKLFQAHGNIRASHHRDGVFWARLPGVPGRTHPGKLDLRSVAPTLLRAMGKKIPAQMRSAPVEFAA